MKGLKLERKERTLLLLSLVACGGLLGVGTAQSRFGRDITALSKRALPLSVPDQALLMAVKANDFNAVRLAIQDGADVNCQDRIRFLSGSGSAPITYYTPLILSTMNSMQARFSRGGRPKHLDIMDYLLDHGADPNLDGFGGVTALHLVSVNGDLDAVRLLLDAGAAPNGSSSHSETPLGQACYLGRFEVAKLLRERGASIDRPDELGVVPLHQVVGERNWPQIARWLIGEGADVNVRDSLGQTPLHQAALFGRAEMVRLLMRAGADPTVRNLRGQTPIDVARQFAASVVERQYEVSSAMIASAQRTQDAMLAAMQGKK